MPVHPKYNVMMSYIRSFSTENDGSSGLGDVSWLAIGVALHCKHYTILNIINYQ